MEVSLKTSIMWSTAFNSTNTSGGEKRGDVVLKRPFVRTAPLINLNYYAVAVPFFTLGGSLYLSV